MTRYIFKETQKKHSGVKIKWKKKKKNTEYFMVKVVNLRNLEA